MAPPHRHIPASKVAGFGRERLAVALVGALVSGIVAACGYFISAAPGVSAATPVAAAEFVGAETCRSCHQAEAEMWRGSHHDLAMQHADEGTVLGDFDDAVFEKNGVETTFFRRDGGFMVRTDGPDGSLQDFPVRYTFGVSPLQQYLLELPGGRLQALSIAWDSRPEADGGQRWYHLYPDEEIPAGDPLHWTGRQQNWNTMCADCHSTNLLRGYDVETSAYKTTWSEINVACEACHGPGSRHVDWARRTEGWQSIAGHGLAVPLDERDGAVWVFDPESGNSQRQAPRETTREIETCALCHARRGPVTASARPGDPIGDSYRVSTLDDGLYFPDGQVRDEVYVYGSFLQSRMFHKGVTCSDCHEPHSLQLRVAQDGVCLQCHGAEQFATPDHHHHAPESEGAACVSCHMPARTYMGVDARRDHSFRIPRPDLSTSLDVPNACNLCHSDETAAWAADHVKSWTPEPKPGFQRFAEILHDGSTGAPGARQRLIALAGDNGHPGIARASALDRLDRIPDQAALEALRKLLNDPDPLVRRSAAGAYRTLPADYRGALLGVLDDPVRDVRLEAALLLAEVPPERLQPADRGKREKGIAEYLESQRSNADRPESHHNIAILSIYLGRYGEAERELKLARRIDPDFVPAAVTLADLYRATGRDAEGEAVLRATIAGQPTAAAAHLALGLRLVRAGRRAEALGALEKAAEFGIGDPQTAYVYGVALADFGQREQAIQVLEAALQRHPYHRGILFALAGNERDAGNINAARDYALRLIELEPQDPAPRQLLEALGQ